MDIRYAKNNCYYLNSIGISPKDIFLVRELGTKNQYFIFAKKTGQRLCTFYGKKLKPHCFSKWEIYTPPADEIERYKKLLKEYKEMSKLERIEKLEAELAELKNELAFKPYLARVHEEEGETPYVALIVVENASDNSKFQDDAGNCWKYATPLTRKEILSYLPPTTKYDWDAILKEYPNAQVAARHPNGDIVIGSQSKIKVGSEGFNSVTQDGGFLFVGDNYRWILDKDCDWRDSIEYRWDVQ